MGVDACLQAYANELMQCMLSAYADDPSSEGFQRMEQLVRGHVSDLTPSDSAHVLLSPRSCKDQASAALARADSRTKCQFMYVLI